MERCFSCAEIGNCTELYVRKPPDYYGPYFPTFERYNPPSSSNAISPDGTVKVCGLCKIYLHSQWQNFESYKLPESRRIYFTKRHDGMPYTGNDIYSSHSESSVNNKSFPWLKSDIQKPLNINNMDSVNLTNKALTNVSNKNNLIEMQTDKPEIIEDSSLELNFSGNNKQLTENYISCFVCGMPCLKWHARTAYSSQMLENKEYFPFFEKLDPPQSSIGLTNGATKICIQCESDLSRQWDHYEKLSTDQMSRIYHITNDHSSQFSFNNPGRFITNSVSNNQLLSMLKLKNVAVKCALCLNKIIDSYKVSWNPRSTCLCIPNLKNFPFPNEGTMVDKVAEEAIICDVCHYFLSCETQSFCMIPLHLREYKLPKVGYLPPLFSGLHESKQTANSNRKPSLGSSLSAFLPTVDNYQQTNSQSKRPRTPNLKGQSKTPSQNNEHIRSSVISKNASTNQDPNVVGPIIANCHTCLQELRDPSALKMLRAIASEEYSDQPFFPFLKILRANSMKNYQFPVCLHCYYNMVGQWQMLQKASIPVHERKYNHNEFMCTQCQRLYAQKSDTLILRDRLVCVNCSETRNSDVKSIFSVSNQDNDAIMHGLYPLKTKTTVTVTPISNEISVPSLASFNYAEPMKQYSKTSTSTSSSPSSANNSISQFVDSFPRNSSIQPDIYYNSKNLFGKNMKRPAVAAVAPNQRQNTPLIQSDFNASHADFSHLKIPDLGNFPGNIFSHNSAFNPFSVNSNTSSSSNTFPLPIFSSNSLFGIPSHSSMSRKHSSTNLDRDYLMKHTQTFSSPYLDHKSSNNSTLHSSSNPFINWQQPQQQSQLNEINPTCSFGSMSSLDPFNSASNNTKDVELTLKNWFTSLSQMQSNSDSNTKFLNSIFNNSQLMEEMAAGYWQMMLSSQMGMGREDLLAPNIGLSNLLGTSCNNNFQSWMTNNAITNYQYQMMQMLAAYQLSMAGSQQYPHGLNKPQSFPSWLNQLNYNDSLLKLGRHDAGFLDPILQSQMNPNSNGISDLMKNKDFFKTSFGLDYDKIPNSLLSFNHTATSSYGQSYHKQQLNCNNNGDRAKSVKQPREDSTRNNEYRVRPSSPMPPAKISCNNDTKCKKTNRNICQSDALDLSQNRSTRKSSYAIDSLTEHGKTTETESEKITKMEIVSSIKNFQVMKSSSPNDIECPLNMSNTTQNNLLESVSNNSCRSVKLRSVQKENYLITILTDLNAKSLIEMVKSMPNILSKPTSKSQISSSSCSSSHASSLSSLLGVIHNTFYPSVWQFHQFLTTANSIIVDLKESSNVNTKTKSKFMQCLGLQDSFTIKRRKRMDEMKFHMIKHIKSSSFSSKKTKHDIFWTKWILRNLNRRLSLENKPHLRRSLMRPVLSGNTEVRFCAAKNKHEMENLRNIIKILIKYT